MADMPDPRDRLFDNLRTYAKVPRKQLKILRESIITYDYASCHRHSGVVIKPAGTGTRYYRADGEEHTLKDVPFRKIIRGIEAYIKDNISHDQRPDAFSNEPETAKTNAQLIDELASSAELKTDSAASVALQITWRDALCDADISCDMRERKVVGGRLGRDHTLEDVPNHYIRDRLMDYINEFVESPGACPPRGGPSSRTCPKWKSTTSPGVDTKIPRYYDEPVRDSRIDKNIAIMNEPLEKIDPTIDITPYPEAIYQRNYDQLPPISRSVVTPSGQPSHLDTLPSEEQHLQALTGDQMYYDCDQVRAMIKIFVNSRHQVTDRSFIVN
ncbi:hypothetical protein B0H66DRAFT_602375 [Apodospora peruviana]|uniref:Uncharacterized protein n=1 Tax=Apodospora peruviana TaxID=516989 RepID=A0AAE0IET5_9PEZI|nr:hypothetical protein B0H66DRAFT_602375 [Apodospora peruviana]